MRDAFGGAFSIRLMIIFLVLYISFICVAISYSRAFRVKNKIINVIEEYEGYTGAVSSTIDDEINSYLAETGYHIEYDQVSSKSSCSSSFAGFASGHGYCIVPLNNGDYYRVETYMVFSIPIVGVKFPIAIKGETRKIEG